MDHLYRRGCSILPLCSFLSGGSAQCGVYHKRGLSEGQTMRRQCHWTTRRSSLVRLFVFPFFDGGKCSRDVCGRLTVVAISLSHYGCYLIIYIRPLYRLHCHICVTRRRLFSNFPPPPPILNQLLSSSLGLDAVKFLFSAI
jgi:hypothetical protein